MEAQILSETVVAMLALVAPPVIMYVVDLLKVVFKMDSKFAPQAAAGIGIAMAIPVVAELAGLSVINVIGGIAAGITVGYAAVGVHTTSRRKKEKVDESGAMEIE